jgi:hypothetical protein
MIVEVSQCLRKIEVKGDAYGLKRTISAINSSLQDGESGLVVGQCKALIERLCKSILKEQSIEVDASITMGKLAKKTVSALGIEQTGNKDQKTREAFIKLVNSFTSQLENAASSIGTLRNDYCPLAHGRAHNEPQLHMIYAQLVASQTDSLATFVLELIEQHRNFVPEIVFSEHDEFNEYLYEQYGELDIFGDLYQAPDVLFSLNPAAYRRGLEEFQDGVTENE